MTRINKATCAKCPSNRFITFFFSVFNAATGELAYANAGHNPPILVRANGDAEMLEGGGPVLGILPIAPYSEMHAHLEHGDMLVLYSDGVTEANNAAYDEFDEERLIEALKANRNEPADSHRAGRDQSSHGFRRRSSAGRRHYPAGREAPLSDYRPGPDQAAR